MAVVLIPSHRCEPLTLRDFIPDFIEELYDSLCDEFPWFADCFQFAFMIGCIVTLSCLLVKMLYLFFGKQ